MRGWRRLTAAGVRQTSTGDRLEARFKSAAEKDAAEKIGVGKTGQGGETSVESAVLDGHVVMVQEPAKGQAQGAGEMRATAARGCA